MSSRVSVAGIRAAAFAAVSLAFAAEPLSQGSDPRVLLEFPSVLVGFEAPCSPQATSHGGAAPNLPRSFLTSTAVGEVTAETFELQVVADILRVQAACAGAGLVFGPGEPLRLADGSEGRVFHSRPGPGVRPVSVVYAVRQNNLHRYSLWLPSAEDLPREYPRFVAKVRRAK